MNQLTIKQVLEVYHKYKNTKYSNQVSEAIDLCFAGNYDGAIRKINEIPTTKQMLSNLVEKLKGKSVYTGLKDLAEGKLTNTIDNLKVLSSLKTHILIEAKSNPEYIMLLEEVETKYQDMRGKI